MSFVDICSKVLVRGSPEDTKKGKQDGIWEKSDEVVNGKPVWKQEKTGALFGIYYAISYDASKEVWTLNEGTPTDTYTTHIFVSNEKNLPLPFGENVSWKYVKSTNNGPTPLYGDTPTPTVSFTCADDGK